MKVLVYGAGNIGCLYAGLLEASGQDVKILARGQRASDIVERGIVLENDKRGRLEAAVPVVRTLEPEDAYDLILVALPGHRVAEVLPALAANRRSPSVMFFGNLARGPQEMIDALGRQRVLLGFPGAAAVSRDGILRYMICSVQEQPTTLGELDGSRSTRIVSIAEAFGNAGFPVSICENMDAWLKTHVAKISPTCGALYMAGLDPLRLARDREALVLMIRAIREGYAVLDALGIPITPKFQRIFRWIPEPLLLALMRRMIQSPATELKLGHARGARSEMKALAEDFRRLADSAAIETPAIDRLRGYIDPSTSPDVAPRVG